MNTVQHWLATTSTAPRSIGAVERQLAQQMIRDTASVAVLGRQSKAGAVLDRYIATTAGSGSAVIWGRSIKTDPVSAALVNGGAAQSIEYDDWAPGVSSHLGGVIVSAVAAMMPTIPSELAADAVAVALMVIDGMTGTYFQEMYDRGLQPTHLLGTVGSVAALSYGLRLSPEVASTAFGLAATQAIGLRSHTGTRFKGAQGGVAAAAAVRSVLLAKEGMGAGANAVDVVLGLMGLTADDIEGILRAEVSKPTHVALKAFPACGATHTGVEATLVARERFESVAGDPDAEITIVSPPGVLDSLAFPSPKSPDEARFSMPYSVAVAWLKGAVKVRNYSEEAVVDEEVRRFMPRITHCVDPGLAPPAGWSGYPAIVTIKVGAREEEARVDSPLGYPGRPLTETQIREKFVECTAPLFDPDTATQVFAEIAGPTAYDLANKRLGIDPPSLPS